MNIIADFLSFCASGVKSWRKQFNLKLTNHRIKRICKFILHYLKRKKINSNNTRRRNKEKDSIFYCIRTLNFMQSKCKLKNKNTLDDKVECKAKYGILKEKVMVIITFSLKYSNLRYVSNQNFFHYGEHWI